MNLEINGTNIHLKIETYKSIIKLCIVSFFLFIFIVPFSAFSIILLLDILKNNSNQNLTSFLLLVIVLFFQVIFFLWFEFLIFIKIKKNKNILDKKFTILSYLNFFFTFIILIILFIYSFKTILVVDKKEFKFFKKKKK